MPMLAIPSASVEYLRSTITGTFTTSMPVEMAVVQADSEPDSGDWHAATWDGADGDADAKVLIGTGSAIGALSDGLYDVWVRVTATPEVPVLYAGRMHIT